jgi:hypothetical protein
MVPQELQAMQGQLQQLEACLKEKEANMLSLQEQQSQLRLVISEREGHIK